MEKITLKVTSADTRTLDDAVHTIVHSFRDGEYKGYSVTVRPAVDVEGTKVLVREIEVIDPTDKFIKKLAKVIVPNTVNISIR